MGLEPTILWDSGFFCVLKGGAEEDCDYFLIIVSFSGVIVSFSQAIVSFSGVIVTFPKVIVTFPKKSPTPTNRQLNPSMHTNPHPPLFSSY